ncbi:MAG: apolipoprotein N-acyltransferase [Micrococcales bacterium 73-13]|nr:MAG: apolipoprotein N-acyltransferase [Micrococcales bacterium 73-13]
MPSSDRPAAPLPWWAALPTAAIGGIVADLAYPDVGWWPMVLPGVALVLVALIGRGFWMGALIGLVYETVFYLVQIQWASQWVGPIPMVALSLAGGVVFAIGAGLIALAYRWLPRAWPRSWPAWPLRLVLLPIAVAGLWTAREAIFSVWPYGGFAWGRIGHSQIDSPIAHLYAWVGISGMTFLVVWLVALVVEAIRFRGIRGYLRPIAPVLLAVLMLAWPAWSQAPTGSLRIALVQGDGPAGYFDQRGAGDLLAAQVAATAPVIERVRAGDRIDLVLWPEGGSDWDPQTDPYTASVWDAITRATGAPLLGQAITDRDGVYYNTAILWHDGRALDTYDKRHPVVWGEYIPDREFFRLLVPELVNMVGREYAFGTTDAVMDLPTDEGTVRIGVNICYDIVDDALLRESVLEGGRVILATSNNADFGRTDESAQQLAFARIRAAELGRSVVNVSTVGISAVIGVDGRVVESLPWYQPGTIVADVPLYDSITPAAAAGRVVEIVVSALGGLLLLGAGLVLLVTRRRERGPEPTE